MEKGRTRCQCPPLCSQEHLQQHGEEIQQENLLWGQEKSSQGGQAGRMGSLAGQSSGLRNQFPGYGLIPHPPRLLPSQLFPRHLIPCPGLSPSWSWSVPLLSASTRSLDSCSPVAVEPCLGRSCSAPPGIPSQARPCQEPHQYFRMQPGSPGSSQGPTDQWQTKGCGRRMLQHRSPSSSPSKSSSRAQSFP